MRVNIRHISLFSAFKMGCAFTAVTTLCLGAPFIGCSFAGIIPVLTLGSALSIKGLPAILSNNYVLMVLIIILGAFGVAISWTLVAFFFNVAAWMSGGLNVRLARHGKVKQHPEKAPEKTENPMVLAARRNLDRAEALARKKTQE